jgi:uncharacterized membrane protein YczE
MLAIGFAPGGTIGVGTVADPVSIGLLSQVLLPWLTAQEQPGRKGTRGHDRTELRGGRARHGRTGR